MSRPFHISSSPSTIAGCEIRNRILSTGHDTAMPTDGRVNDRLIAYHEARARGGVGLIVTQVTGVHETARYTAHLLMGVTMNASPPIAASPTPCTPTAPASSPSFSTRGARSWRPPTGRRRRLCPLHRAERAFPRHPAASESCHDRGDRGRLRRNGAAHGRSRGRRGRDRRQPRLSALAVPQPADQSARGRLWRQLREPLALPARSACHGSQIGARLGRWHAHLGRREDA